MKREQSAARRKERKKERKHTKQLPTERQQKSKDEEESVDIQKYKEQVAVLLLFLYIKYNAAQNTTRHYNMSSKVQNSSTQTSDVRFPAYNIIYSAVHIVPIAYTTSYRKYANE